MTKKFIEIQVRHIPNDIIPKEYKEKPYYNILYEEDGQLIIGFGTYKVEVLLGYLKDYFNIVPDGASADLISRSALREDFDVAFFNDEDDYKRALRIIDNAQAVPLPDFKDGYKQAIIDGRTNFKPKGKWKGEWIPVNPDCRGYPEYFKCSICGAYIYPSSAEKELDYNGCPYCFADMRGEEE